MSQDNRLTERSVKILREGEYPNIRDGRIVSDVPEVSPEGHVVIPMHVLEKPEPIRKAATHPR